MDPACTALALWNLLWTIALPTALIYPFDKRIAPRLDNDHDARALFQWLLGVTWLLAAVIGYQIATLLARIIVTTDRCWL